MLDLLAEIRAERGLSYLFISYDLAVVKDIADRVLVMRKGHVRRRTASSTSRTRPICRN